MRTAFYAVCSLLVVAAFPALGQGRSGQGVSPHDFVVKKLELRNAKGLVVLDYFAYEDRPARVWVPAGNLGVVAVINGVTGKITTIGGFMWAKWNCSARSECSDQRRSAWQRCRLCGQSC